MQIQGGEVGNEPTPMKCNDSWLDPVADISGKKKHKSCLNILQASVSETKDGAVRQKALETEIYFVQLCARSE